MNSPPAVLSFSIPRYPSILSVLISLSSQSLNSWSKSFENFLNKTKRSILYNARATVKTNAPNKNTLLAQWYFNASSISLTHILINIQFKSDKSHPIKKSTFNIYIQHYTELKTARCFPSQIHIFLCRKSFRPCLPFVVSAIAVSNKEKDRRYSVRVFKIPKCKFCCSSCMNNKYTSSTHSPALITLMSKNHFHHDNHTPPEVARDISTVSLLLLQTCSFSPSFFHECCKLGSHSHHFIQFPVLPKS